MGVVRLNAVAFRLNWKGFNRKVNEDLIGNGLFQRSWKLRRKSWPDTSDLFVVCVAAKA